MTTPSPVPVIEEQTFRKKSALDTVNQEIDRIIQEITSPVRDATQHLTRAFLGGVYEFPMLFGGEAFVPRAGRPPRGVTRERFLTATQQYGQAPSRLAMGAPEVMTQADLPIPQDAGDNLYLRSFVRYGKLLMSKLGPRRGDTYEPLYDPGEYYYGDTGGGGGGTIRVIRGGGTPGSQARNYKAGLINWRI